MITDVRSSPKHSSPAVAAIVVTPHDVWQWRHRQLMMMCFSVFAVAAAAAAAEVEFGAEEVVVVVQT